MKRSFVADASVAIAWVHPAQAIPETDAMLDRLAAGHSLVVPALWPLEVANTLTVLRRRRKLTPDEARTAIEIIRELPAVIDHEAAAIAFTRLVDLASRHMHRRIPTRDHQHGPPLQPSFAARTLWPNRRITCSTVTLPFFAANLER